MKIFGLVYLLIIISFGFEVRAEMKASVSDTTITRLMTNFRYRDAANIIKAKLRKADDQHTDELLYYNNQLSAAILGLE